MGKTNFETVLVSSISAGQVVTGDIMHGVDTGLGDPVIQSSGTGTNIVVESEMLGVDTQLGTSVDAAKHMHKTVQDREPSPASGYATDGTPTYGDGQANNTITWNVDDDDIIAYWSPIRPVITDYDSLPN